MITRVEISGFKSFTDFAVDLAPLSVIAGANASGKSNFLDALQMLQQLTTGKSLGVDVQHRGPIKDIFTKLDLNNNARSITMAVEILTPLEGAYKKALDSTRFRYELTINLYDGEDGLFYGIAQETLRHLDEEEDHWGKQFIKNKVKHKFLRYLADDNKVVFDHFGVKFDEEPNEMSLGYQSDHPWNTLLGIKSHAQNQYIAAVRDVIVNIFPVDLLSSDNFNNYHNPEKIDNLILRETIQLKRKHPEVFHKLSLRVAQVSKNTSKITAEVDDFNRLTVVMENLDGTKFLSDSLSEGTLRVMALGILLYGVSPQRTYLIEEPENGVDPRILTKVADLLLDIVADFEDNDIPLNQIICTTHSPALLDYLVNEVDKPCVTAYLSSISNVLSEFYSDRRFIMSTRIRPIIKDITAPVSDSRAERATLHQAKAYMRHGRPEALTDV